MIRGLNMADDDLHSSKETGEVESGSENPEDSTRRKRRRGSWLVSKTGDSADDWASLGELTDAGPFGWIVGVIAGLLGKRRSKKRRRR